MWAPLTRSGKEERTLELLLRVGVAGCFIGHGAFGVIGKEAWLPYFAALGIGEGPAWVLMPVVGTIDILVGIFALVSPRPLILMYAAFWATWTAVLRPLAGESPFEVLERAGNYGVPLALLILAATRVEWSKSLLREVQVGRMTPERRALVGIVLRATTATLLLGHGGLALSGKPLLLEHLAVIGIPGNALPFLGAVEVGLAVAVALRPLPGLLLFILAWKLGTEALFPISGAPPWEFVERAGSYIAPLGLWTMIRSSAPRLVASEIATGRTTVGLWLAGLAAFALPGFAVLGLEAVTPAADPDSLQKPRLAPADTSLLASLRAGGFVLACRHAITDRNRPDAETVDFDDPSTQRILSPAGERQARRLGEIIKELRVPVDEVLTSPFDRTAESARLSFGPATINRALSNRGRRQTGELQRLFGSEPTAGTNRALMTHQGILYGMMPDLERGSIREGDCMVVRPEGDGQFDVMVRLGPEEWAELNNETAHAAGRVGRASGSARRAETFAVDRGAPRRSLQSPEIDAVIGGGTTVVCRHAITGDTREIEPVDYDDPTTQRLLSPEGERQSVAMGQAIRRLGIEASEVRASPMSRAYRTAELMFDRPVTIDSIWHTNGESYGGRKNRARRRAIATPVDRGSRFIVSHIGTIGAVIPEAKDRLREGDCMVVRGDGPSHRVIGVVPWRAWAEAAPPSGG